MKTKVVVSTVTILLLWGNLAISDVSHQDYLRALNILATGALAFFIFHLKEGRVNSLQTCDYDSDNDPLLPQAKEEILRAGKASASLLQRRLKVGYARAARILDLLEEEGFIGEADGAEPREILKK